MSTAMATTQVGGQTVTNISGGSRKFYRVMVYDTKEIRQWGRIGATGQFKVIDHPGKRAAEASAEAQIKAKNRKGYGGNTAVSFSVDDRLATLSNAQLAQSLAAAYEAAEARSTNLDYESWQGGDDELDDLLDIKPRGAMSNLGEVADRALSVVTLAASGSEEAAIQYAQLREEVKEIEEQYERCQSFLETIEIMLGRTVLTESLTAYPQTWDDFIGQEQVKRQLRVAIESAAKRGTRLPHCLFASGVPGIGKTSLALLTTAEAGRSLHAVSGKMNINEARIALSRLDDGDVLFIDEAHRLVNGGKQNSEWLLHLLQDGVIMGPTGPEKQPDVTVMAATTDVGRLPETIISRFPMRPVLKPYTDGEAAQIVIKMAYDTFPRYDYPEVPLPSNEQLYEIARAASNNPRTIGAILTNLRDLVVVDLESVYDGEQYDLTEPLSWLGLREDGLDESAVRYLVALLEDFAGQAGERALSDRLTEPGGLEHIEASLMQRGLIARTPQGRVLTKAGIARANELTEETA